MKNLFILGMVLLSVNSFAGNEKGNGGFKYFYTSGQYLKATKSFVSNSILDINKEELNKIEQKYGVKIDWNEFAQIVRTTKSSPDKEVSRSNPDGDGEPLVMDTDFSSRKIIALKSFFEEFNDENLNNSEVAELSRTLLHEASHLFGIGVRNDDENSRKFSVELNKLVFGNLYKCNLNEGDKFSGANKILNCTYEKESAATTTEKINLEIDKKSGVCQTRADLWKEGVNGYVSQGTLSYQSGDKLIIPTNSLTNGTIITMTTACVEVKKGTDLLVKISSENNEEMVTGKFSSEEGVVSWKTGFIKLDNNKIGKY